MGCVPEKNVAYTLIFPIFDSLGAFMTGATISSKRVSKDGAAFADTTNAVAEIGADGVYTLLLTATEMNAGNVAVRIVSDGKPVFALIETTVAATDAQLVADEILNRNLAGGGSGNTRNVRNALRVLRNKRQIVGGVFTVFTENDAGTAWTGAAATAPGDPTVSITGA